MAKSKQQKALTLEKLTKLFKESTSAVFADYQGLTVPKADELRKKAYEQKLDYMVAKKTLINLAAKEAGIELNAKEMPGMLGIAFSADDEVAPAKLLGDMTKGTPIKLVGGIMGKKLVTKEHVIALSKLPTRTQLYGMFVSTINGPISAFARALDAIRKQKEAAVS
ncbi:MAG: 50S ribosomal protein L10 [Patescibacteria group bacterium]|jgi:large subunit ribosomal protein L10